MNVCESERERKKERKMHCTTVLSRGISSNLKIVFCINGTLVPWRALATFSDGGGEGGQDYFSTFLRRKNIWLYYGSNTIWFEHLTDSYNGRNMEIYHLTQVHIYFVCRQCSLFLSPARSLLLNNVFPLRYFLMVELILNSCQCKFDLS